jgi:hypothetical protein
VYGRNILHLQSRRRNIRAIVRDTVHSVGIYPKGRPYTAYNPIVRTFRHAVSLDERRAKFRKYLWRRNDVGKPAGAPAASSSAAQTSVAEVWFSGCHCGQFLHPASKSLSWRLSDKYIYICADVGGGSVQNDTPHSLARLSLRWMIRECFKANTVIMFKSDRLRIIGLDPASLYPIVRSRPPRLSANNHHLRSQKTDKRDFKLPAAGQSSSAGTSPGSVVTAANGHAAIPTKVMTEEEHELHDSLSPAYDQLELAPIWWILEYLPLPRRYKRSDNTTGWTISINRGRPRPFPPGMMVHRSVKMRQEAQPEPDAKKTIFQWIRSRKDGYEELKQGYVPRIGAEALKDAVWVD